jgi:Cd2+/Zn2+-exporting ATPase
MAVRSGSEDKKNVLAPALAGFTLAERRQIAGLAAAFVLLMAGIIFEKTLDGLTAGYGSSILFVALWAFAGREALGIAVRNIIRGRIFDENFLMALASVGAMAVDAMPEAAGVMVFYAIGEFLQERAVANSRRQIAALLDIRPESARILTGEGPRLVPPSEVESASEILIMPGERVPLDALILTGSSLVDAAAFTGESLPREVAPGQELRAGEVNLSGSLVARTLRPFGESAVARILDLVENATARKARTERFFSTFARWYTPGVVAVAAATAVLPPLFVPGQRLANWGYRALIMLVISCPCALVASIPLAYFGGIGAASRRGILVKGSDYLDALARVDTVVLDKTGTITTGRFGLRRILPAAGMGEEELLALAAAVEAGSGHPIAQSILRAFEEARGAAAWLAVVPEGLRTLPDPSRGGWQDLGGMGASLTLDGRTVLAGSGRLMRERAIRGFSSESEQDARLGVAVEGVSGDASGAGGIRVHLARDGVYAGSLVIGDTIKEDSASAIARLRRLGVSRLIMLTGDGEAAAAGVARAVGIEEYHASLLPADKLERFESITGSNPDGQARPGSFPKERRRKGGRTLFVGDGINDAPVLARADIGVSMGGVGSAAAVESSDVVLMDDSLSRLPDAIRIALATRRILVQNIVFALGVKALFIVLGFFGLASMWEAVFGDVGVAILAVLNASRVLRAGTPTATQ